MSEGGFLPWKTQRIDNSRGPAANYSNIRSQLPDVPKGMKWERNDTTREWSVVPVAKEVKIIKTRDATEGEETVQDAIPIQSDNEVMQQVVAASSDGSNFVFVEHRVESTDTFAGICLKYSVSPTQLRQINRFSGTNLQLAPPILLVPIAPDKRPSSIVRVNEPKDYRVRAFMSGCGGAVSKSEAISYLEINNNDVQLAIENYKDDMKWDSQQNSNTRNQHIWNSTEESDGDEVLKKKSCCFPWFAKDKKKERSEKTYIF